MDEDQQVEAEAAPNSELEALVALVEMRVIENLTRIIERIAQKRAQERSERPT